jgi:hypothetical protein
MRSWQPLGVTFVLALVAACAKGKTPGATDEERRRDDARAALRRACGISGDAALHETSSVAGECQKAVLPLLAAPQSAAFPGMFDDEAPLASPLGCETVYRSWVESRDAHGVEVRRAYVCTYDPRTGVARVELQ